MDKQQPAYERLVQARKGAGFKGASDAARALGVSLPTYLAHENGSRGFARTAEKYARKFKVDLGWLMSGNGQNPKSEKLSPDVMHDSDTSIGQYNSGQVEEREMIRTKLINVLGTLDNEHLLSVYAAAIREATKQEEEAKTSTRPTQQRA